ncbi:AAA domain-containing protein [Flaviflexus equikiangi]|uniref:AAA domain-containing protein n=1 Tax=Flaviflexus equikiangi TaxID=2758573 RepID=UPI0015F706C1|nr:AAA domain-containing protein [Flaviflexus equikiangi]
MRDPFVPSGDTTVLEQSYGLLQYLSAVAREIGPKPVRDVNQHDFTLWPDEVGDHSAITIGPAGGGQCWLEVRRVAQPAPATIPDSLRPFLRHEDSLSSPLVPPVIDEEALREYVAAELRAQFGEGGDEDRSSREQALTEEVTADFEEWRESWNRWAEDVRPAYMARELYSRLYDLHIRSEAESATHEVVWGHIVLSCRAGGERIVAPLFTTPVSVQIHPTTGALRIEPEQALSMELDALEGVGFVGLDRLVGIQGELRDNPRNLWSDTERYEIRQQLVAPLGVDATLVDSPARIEPESFPRINDGWVLFKRKRALRQERFYDELAQKIQKESFVPEALASVVSDEESVDRTLEALGFDVRRDDGTAERLLMPLPANQEQERIARQLAHSRGVTVQGPPGTGKSHTIVNLVSHLVAQGKRVLVTAENEQALSVLRDKIPEELRDLSIAVLGSTPAAMEDLRSAVQSMQDSLSSLDERRETRRIDELAGHVDALRETLQRIDADLVEALLSEQRVYSLPGGPKRARKVASWLSANRDKTVIADPVPSDAGPFPLSMDEFADFIAAVESISSDDTEASVKILPEGEWLPSSEELAQSLARQSDLASKVTALEENGLRVEALDDLSLDAVRQLLSEVRTYSDMLRDLSGAWEERFAQAIRESHAAVSWVLENNSAVLEKLGAVDTWAKSLAGREVTVPAGNPAMHLQLLGQWQERLAIGKKIPLFGAKDLKEFAAHVHVDGYPVTTVEQLDLVRAKIHVDSLLRETRVLMEQAYSQLAIPVPDLDASFRFHAENAAQRIIRIAALWREDYVAMTEKLSPLVTLHDPAKDSETLGRVADLLTGAAARLEERELDAELAALKARVRGAALEADASPLWHKLSAALDMGRVDQWAEALEETQRLLGIRSRVLSIQDCRERISKAGAPLWAAAIVQSGASSHIVGEPADVGLAWELAKARTWLTELHGLFDVDSLMKKSHEASRDLQSSIVELANRSARVALKNNMKDVQRRALETWMTAVKKVGKGTGKNAARYQAAAREALPEAMGAVPIWIMPIYRVMENFDPRVSELFDVVVVDESSQADLLTLGVLALGKKAVVVGDDKQTTPERVGTKVDRIASLQDLHLKDLRSTEAKLLTLDESLYSISSRAFPSTIALKEHFRCVPEIINFSNRYYNHGVLPLREVGVPEIGEPLRAVKVEGAISELNGSSRINRDEAKAVAHRIAECVKDPAYDGLTFGVVTMMSGRQSDVLQSLIRDAIGDEEFEKRRLRVGNPPLFQGDERNVMFISMVAHDNSFAATTQRYSQWVNVAASRAQDQLWVFYSMDPATLNHHDERRALIEYVQGHSKREDRKELFELTESKFEGDILVDLLSRGLTVQPQHKVGSYRIDFVVELSRGNRLAIECDGDAFHGPDRWDDDVRRQRVLERLGWTFWRIRASEYYLDREKSLVPLWELLDEMKERAEQAEAINRARQQAREQAQLAALRAELAEGVRVPDESAESSDEDIVAMPEDENGLISTSPEAPPVSDDHRQQHGAWERAGELSDQVFGSMLIAPNSVPTPTPSEAAGNAKPHEAQDAIKATEEIPASTTRDDISAELDEESPRSVVSSDDSTTTSSLENQASKSKEDEEPKETRSSRRALRVTRRPGIPPQTIPRVSEAFDTEQSGNAGSHSAVFTTVESLDAREIDRICLRGEPYHLDLGGEIIDGASGRTLSEVIGERRASEVSKVMREVRHFGGRFRVDDKLRLVTTHNRRPVYLGTLHPDYWFPKT